MFRRFLWLCTAVVLATFGACGGQDADTDADAERAAAPRRIASLAPSLTELLFELGLGDRVVAVTRYCDRPRAAAKLPAVSDSKQVSLEALVDLRPDLIIFNSKAVEAQLQPIRTRYTTLMAPTETIPEMLATIENIGRATGAEEPARALRKSLQDLIDTTRAKHAGAVHGKVLVVLQRDPFFVAGPGSYVDELLQILGWENAAAGLSERWPRLSTEGLLQYRPDVILDLGIGNSASVREVEDYWKQFETVPAVRTGRVYALRANVLVRPGPALPETLAELEQCLARGPDREPK